MNFKIAIGTTTIALLAFTLISFEGCVEYRDNPNCPYMSFEEFRATGVEILPPQNITLAGKIYTYHNTLLVQEVNRGIHIIDNRDKHNPISKQFIKIMGNMDMAVKDGYLYIDSYMDLVVLDIRDLENIKKVNRVENSFSYDPYQNFEESYYGCGEANLSKGILLRGENS